MQGSSCVSEFYVTALNILFETCRHTKSTILFHQWDTFMGGKSTALDEYT
jgi:hypothetical protein